MSYHLNPQARLAKVIKGLKDEVLTAFTIRGGRVFPAIKLDIRDVKEEFRNAQYAKNLCINMGKRYIPTAVGKGVLEYINRNSDGAHFISYAKLQHINPPNIPKVCNVYRKSPDNYQDDYALVLVEMDVSDVENHPHTLDVFIGFKNEAKVFPGNVLYYTRQDGVFKALIVVHANRKFGYKYGKNRGAFMFDGKQLITQ